MTIQAVNRAFTLIEVVISIAILGMVMAGLIYGYVQANWSALWSSMSLSAQTFASEGAEQARAADWRPRDYPAATGPGTMDELPSGTIITNIGFMDVPGDTGTNKQFSVTNIVAITTLVSGQSPAATSPVGLLPDRFLWKMFG